MTRLPRTAGRPAATRAGWRKRLGLSLLALALAFPATARSSSLEQLLRLPLERLLQLEISPRPASKASSHSASTPGRLRADGGGHAA
jgi:hypothetical protein